MSELIRAAASLSILNPTPYPPAPPVCPVEDVVFRRTFLWRFEDPDSVATFEKLGAQLGKLLAEAGYWGPDEDQCLIRSQIRAAAEDLDLLAAYLLTLGYARFSSTMDAEERRLCELAEGWAGALLGVFEEMRGAVGAAH